MTNIAPLVAIVDDEESIRRALLRVFRLSEYQAGAFATAAEFLESMTTQPPDCLILDLHMPDMTGIDLLRELPRLKEALPVIIITANDDQHVLEECLALGVRDFLRKPIDCDTLLRSVRSAICQAI